MTIDAEELERLEEIAQKATPGPWRRATGNVGNLLEAQTGRQQDGYDDGYRPVATIQSCGSFSLYDEEEANKEANIAFVSAASAHFLSLIAELKKARAIADEYHKRWLPLCIERDEAWSAVRVRDEGINVTVKSLRAERDTACALLRSADAMMAALASPNNPHVNDLRARIDAFLEKRT